MKLATSFEIAWEALVMNKVRATLTMLGIVIGVFSVVVMIGLGQGSQAFVTEQVKGLGSGVVVVTPGSPKTQSSFGGGGNTAQNLKLADALALESIPGVRFISPQAVVSGMLKQGPNAKGAMVIGTSPNIQGARGINVGEGRFFTEQEARSGAKVIVLGDRLAKELFKGSMLPPIGSKVSLLEQRFRVVGLIAQSSGGALGATDDQAFVPTRSLQWVSDQSDHLVSVLVKAEDEAMLPVIQQQVTRILRSRHGIRPDEEDDFKIQDQAELLKTVGLITGAFTVLLGGIAGISLLVGGIGIMNIMLVSVTERTREIGIRKAIGARTGAILRQFLIESATLSLAGGSLGLLLGLAATYGVTRLASLPFVLSPWGVALALLFSGGVGVFFGYYPALQAAKLDPVDALRYE